MLHNINIERHTRFNLQTTATLTNTKQQNKQNMHRYSEYRLDSFEMTAMIDV